MNNSIIFILFHFTQKLLKLLYIPQEISRIFINLTVVRYIFAVRNQITFLAKEFMRMLLRHMILILDVC